jgi:hypothetical protein
VYVEKIQSVAHLRGCIIDVCNTTLPDTIRRVTADVSAFVYQS